jgi:hypothetical protein
MITWVQGGQFPYLQERAIQLGPMGAAQIFHKMQTAILDYTAVTWGRPPGQLSLLAQIYIHGHALLGV